MLRRNSRAADRLEAAWDRAVAEVGGVHIRHATDGFRVIRCQSSAVPVEVAVIDKVVSIAFGTTIPFLRVRLPVPTLRDAVHREAGRLHVEGDPIPMGLLKCLEKDLLAHWRPEDLQLEASAGQLTIRVRNENLTPDQVRTWVDRASRWASGHELSK